MARWIPPGSPRIGGENENSRHPRIANYERRHSSGILPRREAMMGEEITSSGA